MIASNYHNYLIVHRANRAKMVKSGKNQKALSRCTSVLEHLNSRTMKTMVVLLKLSLINQIVQNSLGITETLQHSSKLS